MKRVCGLDVHKDSIFCRKSYQDVVRKLSSGISCAEELFKCIHSRTVNKWGKDTILASLTGIVTEVDVDIIGGYWEEVQLAKQHKQKYQDKMLEICKEHFPEELERIQTIPGIKERSATSIIAELGTDMESFETAAIQTFHKVFSKIVKIWL